MKKVYAIAAVSLIAFIVLAACLSVIAITRGDAFLGNKESITLDQSKYILFLDGEKTASPVVSTDKKHKDYILKSSNPTIFSVGEDGVIIGLKEGIAQLFATSRDAKATATVIVYTSASSSLIPYEEDGKMLVVFVTEYGGAPSQRVFPGELAQDPGTPTGVPDQVVAGWYTDEERTQKFDFSTPITSDITLYAKWTAGDNPTFSFKTLANGTHTIEKLKYPLVAFDTLRLPSEDDRGTPVAAINSKAFQDYTHVETVIIPKEIEVIKDFAFAGCTNLKTVVFEEGSKLKTIEEEAFWKCSSLESITLPSGLTSLGEGAFNECGKLTSINLPDGVTVLSREVFAKSGLTSIDIKNITTIKAMAFKDAASLSTVSNPDKIIKMETSVFTGTEWLSDAYSANNNIAYLGTVLVSYNSPTINTRFVEIIIREDTTLIADHALVNLPNCVIRINTATPPARGNSATDSVADTVNIVVPEQYIDNYKKNSWSICANHNQIYYSLIVPVGSGEVEFLVREYNGITSAVLHKYTGGNTSLNITDIMSNKLGNEAYLERIRRDTFNRTNAWILQSIILPLRLGIIESYAFNACSSLKSIKFEGDCDTGENASYIELESSTCFHDLRDDYKIYLPETLFESYIDLSFWSKYYENNRLESYS